MARIMIVEDNEHMHRIYADKFRREGYEVVDAFNGNEALIMAAHESPEVILLDLMMPVMDGFEALQKLKANPATANIPVLVISNKSMPVDMERASLLGAHDFFHKGMTLLDDLAIKVRKLCNLKKAMIVSARQIVADAIRSPLSAVGFICSTSTLVLETVSRAEREQPDVIFLDTQIQNINFSILLPRLAASAKANNIPLILVDEFPSLPPAIPTKQLQGQLGMPIDAAKLLELVTSCVSDKLETAAA